jgi:hypothetical protein
MMLQGRDLHLKTCAGIFLQKVLVTGGYTEILITEPYWEGLSENKSRTKNIAALYLRTIFIMKTRTISTKQIDSSSYQ